MSFSLLEVEGPLGLLGFGLRPTGGLIRTVGCLLGAVGGLFGLLNRLFGAPGRIFGSLCGLCGRAALLPDRIQNRSVVGRKTSGASGQGKQGDTHQSTYYLRSHVYTSLVKVCIN